MDRNEESPSGGVVMLAVAPERGDGATDDVPDVAAATASDAVVAQAVLVEPEASAESGAVESGAVESGADASAEADSSAETGGSAETGADVAEPASVGSGRAVPPVSDEPPAVSAPGEGPEASAETEPDDGPEAAEPDAGPAATGAPRPSRRRVSLRRGAAVAAAVAAVALVVALAVSAFSAVVPSAGDADQHFLDTARSQGRVVTGGSQQALLVSAARKICDRRANHTTVAQRRATALSSDELAVVRQTFPGDTRGFTVLALDTYCSS